MIVALLCVTPHRGGTGESHSTAMKPFRALAIVILSSFLRYGASCMLHCITTKRQATEKVYYKFCALPHKCENCFRTRNREKTASSCSFVVWFGWIGSLTLVCLCYVNVKSYLVKSVCTFVAYPLILTKFKTILFYFVKF